MTVPSTPPPWAATQSAILARDQEVADWYAWAAARRLQQAHRELALTCQELRSFQDSMMLQLAQLQQHERRPRTRQLTTTYLDGHERESLRARIRMLHMMGLMFDEAHSMMQFHTTVLAQMATVARAAAPAQGDPTDN